MCESAVWRVQCVRVQCGGYSVRVQCEGYSVWRGSVEGQCGGCSV